MLHRIQRKNRILWVAFTLVGMSVAALLVFHPAQSFADGHKEREYPVRFNPGGDQENIVNASAVVDARANCSCGGEGKDTGIDISKNDVLIVNVSLSDRWSAGSDEPCSRESDVNGLTKCYGSYESAGLTAKYGSLVGRIGDGPFFLLGASYKNKVTESGRLRLYYWDDYSSDNSGAITANLIVKHRSAEPESEVATKSRTASSADAETGITTTSVKNQDGSTTVTKKNSDGTILSEETIKKDKQDEAVSYSVTDHTSGITTASVNNSDGTRTITKTDKDGKVISKETFPPKGKGLAKGTLIDPITGDVTAVLTNPDGSRSIAKSKVKVDKDGTEHTIAMDENGNSIESTITPDGVVTTKKTDKYGNTTKTVMDKNGALTSVEKTVTGYTTETSRDTVGLNKIIKKDLDGSVMETIEIYPDGTTVTTDKYGNSTEVLAPNENGETITVKVDGKGNEKLVVTNDMGEVIFKDETRVTPKEPGREYYERVMGGEEWDKLPRSSKTRYAGSERRLRENEGLEQQRDAREQEELKTKQKEGEWLAKSHEKLDKDLAVIKAEQVAADKKAAARNAKKARELDIRDSYEKADKLQQQYDEAIKRGDRKEAKRIERLQNDHEQASMKILAFTEDEKKEMERKSARRQELMNQINKEASFLAHKEDMERTKNDAYKDVAMKGVGFFSIGVEQQKDLAKSNRQEDRMLSKTKHKDMIIERLLNQKDLTPDDRGFLIDAADMSSLQRAGALEKKAANNRIVRVGYAADVAMLLSGSIGNVVAGLGSKAVGKVAAAGVATKVFVKKAASGVAVKKAAKKALRKGVEVGEKFTDNLMKLGQYDIKTAASKKVIEKVVAKQTTKKILAKKLSEGVTKEIAEKSAKKTGERVGKKVAKELGEEISEKGLINTAGSKAGGKVAEKLAGKETRKTVERELSKKRSIIPESVKKIFRKEGAQEAVSKTKSKTTAEPPVKSVKKTVNKKQAKKPSEMSRAEKQAHNDMRAQKQVSKKWREKEPLQDGGDGILPSPTGKPTELPVGELSKDLTPKEIEALFRSGANLSSKQIQQKADIFRKRLRDAKVNKPALEPMPKVNDVLSGRTTILNDPLKGALGRNAKGGTEVIKQADDVFTGRTTILDNPLKGAFGRSGKGNTQVLKSSGTIVERTGKGSTQILKPAETIAERTGKGGTQILTQEEIARLSRQAYSDKNIFHGNRRFMAKKELRKFAKEPKIKTKSKPNRIDELPQDLPHPSDRRSNFVEARSAWKKKPKAIREKFDQEVRNAIDEAAAIGDKWAKRLQLDLNEGKFDYIYEPGLKDLGIAPEGKIVKINPFKGKSLKKGSPDQAASTLLHEYVHAYKGPKTYKAFKRLPHTGPSTKGQYNEVRAFWAEAQFNRSLKLARGLNGKKFDPSTMKELDGLLGIKNMPENLSGMKKGLQGRRNLQDKLVDKYYGAGYAHNPDLGAERLSTYKGGSMRGIRQRLRDLKGPNGESTPEYEALLETIRKEGGRFSP